MLIATPLLAVPDDLKAYRWEHRVIVVSCPNIEHPEYRQQAAELLAEFPALLERDLIVLTAINQPKFSVKLIGKDGGTKLTRNRPVSTTELFALIDSMPMRQSEIRSRHQTD